MNPTKMTLKLQFPLFQGNNSAFLALDCVKSSFDSLGWGVLWVSGFRSPAFPNHSYLPRSPCVVALPPSRCPTPASFARTCPPLQLVLLAHLALHFAMAKTNANLTLSNEPKTDGKPNPRRQLNVDLAL